VSEKYLLPCPCGQQIVVEPRQAGETIRCSCGAALMAPNLLDMRALDAVPSEPSKPSAASGWGTKRALQFAGTMLVVAALVLEMVIYLNRPVSAYDVFDAETLRKTYHDLPLSQTWQTWQHVKQGLDRRTDQQYAAQWLVCYIEQFGVGMLALAGVAMAVAGTIGARKQGAGG